MQRLAPLSGVGFQVFRRDQPVAARHLLDDEFGSPAAIKVVGPEFGDTFEGVGKLGLDEGLVDADVAEVVAEVRLVAEPVVRVADEFDQRGRREEAVPGQPDGGLDEVTPGQAAETLMGFPEPGDGARYGGRRTANRP